MGGEILLAILFVLTDAALDEAIAQLMALG